MNEASTLVAVHGAAVCVGEIVVGNVSDVFTDHTGERLVGFEIRGQNGDRLFLPWVACSLDGGVIRASSPLVFISSDQVDYYARHGIRVLKDELQLLSLEADGCLRRSSQVQTSGVLTATGEGIPCP